MNAPTVVWDIRDSSGQLVARHHRYDNDDGKKRYAWSSPDDPKGLGGLKTKDLPLYRACDIADMYSEDDDGPFLADGFDDLVVVVEGEKATDAAWQIGVPAVGTVTGAAGTPAAKPLSILGGRNVVLLPDNDDPGRKHMDRIAAALNRVAASCRVLELPELEAGGDLSDWIEAGGTAEELKRLIDNQAVIADPSAQAVEGIRRALAGGGDVPAALRAAAAVELDDIDREFLRGEIHRALKDGGLPDPARMVRAAFKSKPSDGTTETVPPADTPSLFDDPEPWPDEVDAADLLDEMEERFRLHLVLPDECVHTVALWALHTWVFDAFMHTPRLAIKAPEKRCGKSTLLRVLRRLVRRPRLSSSMTASSVFRVVDVSAPTILADEADNWVSRNHDLRAVLNSGHEAEGAVSTCVPVGDGWEEHCFRTFAPVALAGIGKFDYDTLADRSITVNMRRKLPSERVRRIPRDPSWANDLRSQAVRWAADNIDGLRGVAEPVMPALSSDRALDNWLPLIAIADRAGGRWPRAARSAALAIEDSRPEDGSFRVLLLEDLRDIIGDTDRVPTKDILAGLHDREERPWPEWGRDRKPMTARALAAALHPYGIKPTTARINGSEPIKCYTRESFEDAWARYLEPQP